MSGAEIPLMIGSMALSAYSSYRQGKAAESESYASAQQAKAEAAYHAYNAEVAEKESQAEQQATLSELKQHRRESKKIEASLRARVGKSGVIMEGSPLLVAEDTASQLALEHALMAESGARSAGQWHTQSMLDIKQSSMAKQRARSYVKAGRRYANTGFLKAGSSLLGGGASVAYMRSQGSPWWPS